METSWTEALLLLMFSICVLNALRIIFEVRVAVANIHNHPGYRVLLNPSSFLPNMIPRIKGIALGYNYTFLNKHTPFEQAGCDALSVVSFFPKAKTTLVLADAAAIKEVASSRYLFPKHIHNYKVLMMFGKNIIASEGDEWKRYRKIAAPAFSDRNNVLVWNESCRIMLDLFNTTWGDQDEIAVDHCVDITLQITLSLISMAGFGRRMAWKDDQGIPSGHQMTFDDALHVCATDIKWKLLMPSWAMGLTARLRRINLAVDELEKYMIEMIQDRKTSKTKEERYDLFSNLLSANDDEDKFSGEAKLSTKEVIGNIFIFHLAGHETTGHTLGFTFALLALYPDEQELLFQHIKRLLPNSRLPNYEEMPLLTYPMAVFNETLRMFPSVPAIPKESATDSILTVSNAAGETKSIPVPQGTGITFNTIALHYNPRYWEDPYTFKPSRFLGDWPRDAFIPFSAGARGCLGRKFAETESVAVLTMLVSRYKIELKEEAQFACETFEEKKARILQAKPSLSLAPNRVPLVFKRRY